MSHNVKKGISLYQPFANLITLNEKKLETRFYHRNFRGDILICASKKAFKLEDCKNLMTTNQYQRFLEIRKRLSYDIFGPIGVAQCVATITDWREMNNIEDLQTSFVGFHPNRWVAVLENIRPIVTFPLKGRQGLFPLSEAEQELIEFGQ